MKNSTLHIDFVLTIIQVQKINIAYSRTAKTVDVKKVKDVMWDIMTSSSCDADKVRPLDKRKNLATLKKANVNVLRVDHKSYYIF